jgi:hypothetical protein
MESARSIDQARAIVAAGYRYLSKQCHPDAGGTHEAMLALGEARALLDDLLGENGKGTPPPRRRAPGGRKMDDATVTFEDVEVLIQTEKALLCLIDEEEHWIPLSQIDEDSEVYKMGTKGLLIIPRWLAKKKGLI